MGVALNPKNIGQNKPPAISVLPANKMFRARRVKEDLDHVFTESEVKARASAIGLPYIDLYGFPIDTAHLILLTKQEVEKYKIGVFTIKGKEVLLATPDPGYTGQEQVFRELKAKKYTPKLFLCSETSLDKIVNTYQYVMDIRSVNDEINITDEVADENKKYITSLADLETQLSRVSLSNFIETILSVAIESKASDIHFEPEKDVYNLRFRLDGVLHTFAHLDKSYQKSIESRIKIVSHLKLNVDNVPQDGRFSFKISGREVDVRVSMLPSNYGYSIVMRLLGTGTVALELSELGFTGLAKKRVEDAVKRPQGLILTTGPTGSGKTTTLYTFLKTLNDGESKIITLEDPIEYKLTGVSQTQIDASAGYTFASGLRSILRQDPDIVMVGEIRDKETAEIAVQASLTGHKVLSTVHTNDAASSVPRLMELDVKGFLLADSLALVIGQRLVRRLCEHCKVVDPLTDDERKVVVEQLKKISKASGVSVPSTLRFHTSKGCKECNNLGYKGRIGVYEVLVVTEGLRRMLSEKYPSIADVRDVAQEEGMITMLQDAILKALDGVTDMKEILRNVG